MNLSGFLIRTLLLALFTLSLLAGAIISDYYLRHEVSGKAARYLTSRGIEISTFAAIKAAGQGEIQVLTNLESAGLDLGLPDDYGFTPLLAAIYAGDRLAIQFLMDRNGVIENINVCTTQDRDTPLSVTLRDRNYQLAAELVEAGAKIDVDVEAGYPILLDAVEKKDLKLFNFLLSHGADVEYRGVQPVNALALAASSGDYSLMKRIIKKGADVNTRGESGNPLLVEAVLEGDLKKARLLLENGAEVNVHCLENESMGLTSLSYAISQDASDIVNILFEYGADLDINGVDGDPLIYQAIAEADLVATQHFLDLGANPNIISREGKTPLEAAVSGENIDAVELLLAGKADPSLAGRGLKSPLLLAIENGNIAIANLLISYGAKFDKQKLLAKAYGEFNTPLVSLLLEAGADPESAIPKSNERLFDVAVREGANGAVRTLLDSGAVIGSSLWSALLSEQDEMIRLIVNGGASPRQLGPSGEDPLEYVLRRKRYKAARSLLAGGAEPNARYDSSELWLFKAVREGDSELALILIEAGAEVKNMKTKDGHTLLGWSIAHQMADVVDALLKAGVDPNEDERSPVTPQFCGFFESNTFKYHLHEDRRIRPIMMAAAQQNREITQLLMDAGANGRASTAKYLTAAIIGSWNKDADIQQIVLLGKAPKLQPRKVVVDLSSQRMTLYENGVATYSSSCSTGKSGHRTPTGSYVISDQHRYHTSSIYGSSMPYFQRFSFTAFGLHQGYVPNYPASAGCIRLPYEAARHMFGKLQVGDYAVVQQ